ncbi:hypothetical protein MAR_017230 [Mya arenaria]|uniref:DZANK-type domain-containing protein n=1 Tax=Mya arenaria TaxID=6604 RepID=A0ABY7EEP4_MYAAR|nr:hypothetical protein MAR_017230 [Mya arenaria]
MKKCSNPECGLEGEERFCYQCGCKMIDPPTIPLLSSIVIICDGEDESGSLCGAELKTIQKFCSKCGKKVDTNLLEVQTPNIEKCGRCGTALSPGEHFCPECGFKEQPMAKQGADAPQSQENQAIVADKSEPVSMTTTNVSKSENDVQHYHPAPCQTPTYQPQQAEEPDFNMEVQESATEVKHLRVEGPDHEQKIKAQTGERDKQQEPDTKTLSAGDAQQGEASTLKPIEEHTKPRELTEEEETQTNKPVAVETQSQDQVNLVSVETTECIEEDTMDTSNIAGDNNLRVFNLDYGNNQRKQEILMQKDHDSNIDEDSSKAIINSCVSPDAIKERQSEQQTIFEQNSSMDTSNLAGDNNLRVFNLDYGNNERKQEILMQKDHDSNIDEDSSKAIINSCVSTDAIKERQSEQQTIFEQNSSAGQKQAGNETIENELEKSINDSSIAHDETMNDDETMNVPSNGETFHNEFSEDDDNDSEDNSADSDSSELVLKIENTKKPKQRVHGGKRSIQSHNRGSKVKRAKKRARKKGKSNVPSNTNEENEVKNDRPTTHSAATKSISQAAEVAGESLQRTTVCPDKHDNSKPEKERIFGQGVHQVKLSTNIDTFEEEDDLPRKERASFFEKRQARSSKDSKKHNMNSEGMDTKQKVTEPVKLHELTKTGTQTPKTRDDKNKNIQTNGISMMTVTQCLEKLLMRLQNMKGSSGRKLISWEMSYCIAKELVYCAASKNRTQKLMHSLHIFLQCISSYSKLEAEGSANKNDRMDAVETVLSVFSSRKNEFIHLYCAEVENFNTTMKGCLTNIAMKAIDGGYTIEYWRLGLTEKERFRDLLSDLFQRQWQTVVTNGPQDAEYMRIIKMAISWEPIQLFVRNQTEDTGISLLIDECKENLQIAMTMLESHWETLETGKIDIGILQMISDHSEGFSDILALIRPNESGLKDKVLSTIKIRMNELEAFKNQSRQMTVFVSHCQHLESVDTRAIEEVLQKTSKLEKHSLMEFCKPKVVEDSDGTSDPDLRAFDVEPAVLDILPKFERLAEGFVFIKIWIDTCLGTTERCKTPLDVVNVVWKPVFKRFVESWYNV